MEEWLTHNTFLNKIISTELRLTFLQLIIITLDLPDALEHLKEQLLAFTAKQIKRILDENEKTSNLI